MDQLVGLAEAQGILLVRPAEVPVLQVKDLQVAEDRGREVTAQVVPAAAEPTELVAAQAKAAVVVEKPHL
jgi:hypothetical protein